MDNFEGYLEKIQKIRNSNTLGKRFARGAYWLFIGNALAQLLSLGASIIIARLLGQVGFGEFGMINSTIGAFGVFAGLGLGLTSTKYVAEWRVNEPERAGRMIGVSTLLALSFGGVISLLVFFISPQLAEEVINAPHLVYGLKISCLLLFFNALNGMQMGALSGLEAFKKSAQINVFRGISIFFASVVGTWFFQLKGAIWATVIAASVVCMLSYLAIQKECKNKEIPILYAYTQFEWEILWKFSLPALINGVILIPAMWAGNTMLANQPNGYAELGLINAANQWRNILIFLPTIFNGVALPILSLENANSRNQGFNTMLDITQSVTIIVAIPIVTIILLLGDPIMHLYGDNFSSGTPTLIGIVSGIAVSVIGGAAGVAIQSKGKMWLGVVMNTTWALVYIIFVNVFVSYWKAFSLAIGFLLAHTILLVWGYIYLASILPKGMLRRTFASVLFVLLLAFVSAFFDSHVKIWLSVPLIILSLVLPIGKWSSPLLRQRIVYILSN